MVVLVEFDCSLCGGGAFLSSCKNLNRGCEVDAKNRWMRSSDLPLDTCPKARFNSNQHKYVEVPSCHPQESKENAKQSCECAVEKRNPEGVPRGTGCQNLRQ